MLFRFFCDINIKVKTKSSESGASGGFMTALAIYNALTSDDITKGKIIAGTGTIDSEGNVGVIGGVKYKLSGAVKNHADIMLVLGVSGCMFLPFIRRKFKGKIITNIDGLEWKRDKWNPLAKWLLHYSEKQAVKYSDVVIGDNKGITDYVKEAYKKDSVLIAYGGDHVTKVQDDSLYEKYPYMKHPYAVTVCRIEPENNVHKIIEAFSRIPEKQLVIVGNWKNSEYGTNLKEQFSKFENIV